MNPLDRINQLNNENALFRSQLHDAQEQAKRDSETIARLAAINNEALGAINRLLHADHCICENVGSKSDQAMHRVEALDFAEQFLSRHA